MENTQREYREAEQNSFSAGTGEDVHELIIWWGIEGNDRDKCSHTSFSCTGEAEFLPRFDLSAEPVQQRLAVRSVLARSPRSVREPGSGTGGIAVVALVAVVVSTWLISLPLAVYSFDTVGYLHESQGSLRQ